MSNNAVAKFSFLTDFFLPYFFFWQIFHDPVLIIIQDKFGNQFRRKSEF